MEPQFYILNHIDRPDSYHVVQTISENFLVYIEDKLRDWQYHDHGFEFRDETTNLVTFGFDITLNKNDTVTFEKKYASEATYRDGSCRYWQGKRKFTLRLKPMLNKEDE